MKNHIRSLLILFLGLLCLNTGWAQTTYKITKKLDITDIYKLIDSQHGIDVSSTNTSWSGNVEVSVKSKASLLVNRQCEANALPNQILIYNAWVTGNTTGLSHTGPTRTYWYKSWNPFSNYGCESERTDKRDYFASMAATTAERIHSWNWFGPTKYDVEITLILPNEVKLSDLKKVKIPGVSDLYPTDFVNKGYLASHGCNGQSNTLCNRMNTVRSIPNLNATDVIIQAHRGIWGKRNTNQENTIGAMQAAVSNGYYLLESDIMPIKVQDNGNYVNPNSGIPTDLACFHDFVLTRYTSETNDNNRIYNRTETQLKALSLYKPRTETVGSEKIMMFDELVNYAATNNRIVCVDMKNLESKGSGGGCSQLCDWQTQARKDISLYHNLKFAINNTPDSKLKNLAFKTYAEYDDLKSNLTSSPNAVSEAQFNKVLWAPLIAPADKWRQDPNSNTSPFVAAKIQKYLDDWFAHNESVLYYETNFFNEDDNESAIMLTNNFCATQTNGSWACNNIMEYIYKMSGRRAGIFSEEPVGGKGTVSRWGDWNIKGLQNKGGSGKDRRGDHLWLLDQAYFKHAVITTDRPDLWDQLND